MSKITKTAVVSVVGRPNVGKSTLTNKLVGQKVAIVSSKPQTTRTRITGVLSRGETQYVLLDTPGLHKPRSRLGDYMCKVVTDTVSEVDVAVLVVEPIPNIGPAEESLIAQIKQHHMPAKRRTSPRSSSSIRSTPSRRRSCSLSLRPTRRCMSSMRLCPSRHARARA